MKKILSALVVASIGLVGYVVYDMNSDDETKVVSEGKRAEKVSEVAKTEEKVPSQPVEEVAKPENNETKVSETEPTVNKDVTAPVNVASPSVTVENTALTPDTVTPVPTPTSEPSTAPAVVPVEEEIDYEQLADEANIALLEDERRSQWVAQVTDDNLLKVTFAYENKKISLNLMKSEDGSSCSSHIAGGIQLRACWVVNGDTNVVRVDFKDADKVAINNLYPIAQFFDDKPVVLGTLSD